MNRGSDETSWPRRHGYLVVATGIVVLSLAMFGLVEALDLDILARADSHIDEGSWVVALLGVGLLVADVALPVPSSGVMLAQGAEFGFVVGSTLSLVGGTAATVVAYVVGRRSRHLVSRFVSAEQQRRATELLSRHGSTAIIVTRPLPVMAETVAILAGVNNALPVWKIALAGAVGNVVPAVVYGAAGASAAASVNGPLFFALVMLVAALVWLAQRQRVFSGGPAMSNTPRSS